MIWHCYIEQFTILIILQTNEFQKSAALPKTNLCSWPVSLNKNYFWERTTTCVMTTGSGSSQNSFHNVFFIPSVFREALTPITGEDATTFQSFSCTFTSICGSEVQILWCDLAYLPHFPLSLAQLRWWESDTLLLLGKQIHSPELLMKMLILWEKKHRPQFYLLLMIKSKIWADIPRFMSCNPAIMSHLWSRWEEEIFREGLSPSVSEVSKVQPTTDSRTACRGMYDEYKWDEEDLCQGFD